MKADQPRCGCTACRVDDMPLWQWLALVAIFGTTLAVLCVLAWTIVFLHVTGGPR